LTPGLISGKELKKANVEFICGDDKMLCLIKLLSTKKIQLTITKDFDSSYWELETDCEELKQNDPHWSSFDIEQVYCIIVECLRENKFVFEIEPQFARLEILLQIVSVKFNLKIEIPEKKCDNDSLVSHQGEHIRKLLKNMEKLKEIIVTLESKRPKKVFLLPVTSSTWDYNQAAWIDFPNATGQVELKQDTFYKWDLLINGLCANSYCNESNFRLYLQSKDKTVAVYQPSEAGFKKYFRHYEDHKYDELIQERNTLTVGKSAVYTIKVQVSCPSGSGYGISWSSAYGTTSLFVEEI